MTTPSNPKNNPASPLFDRVKAMLSHYMSRNSDSDCFNHDRSLERALVSGRYATQAEINCRREEVTKYFN